MGGQAPQQSGGVVASLDAQQVLHLSLCAELSFSRLDAVWNLKKTSVTDKMPLFATLKKNLD